MKILGWASRVRDSRRKAADTDRLLDQHIALANSVNDDLLRAVIVVHRILVEQKRRSQH